MKTSILRYGLISGIILVSLSWINYFIMKPYGYKASEIGGWVGILLALSMVYFGMRYFRDAANAGKLSFGKALQVGAGITLVPAVFMFFSTVVFFTVKGQEFKAWAESSMHPEQLQAYKAAIAQNPGLYDSALFQGLIMFLTVFIIGIIISLISALILKRA